MKTLLREKQKKYDEIGDRGERLVIEQERVRLADTPFALAVNGNVSEDMTAGFDVLSFDTYGKPIYIEVKTTVGGENTPFYMSRRELEFARTCCENGDYYELRRLFDLDEADHCGTQTLSAEEFLSEYEFIPVSYQVRTPWPRALTYYPEEWGLEFCCGLGGEEAAASISCSRCVVFHCISVVYSSTNRLILLILFSPAGGIYHENKDTRIHDKWPPAWVFL